MIEDVKLTQEEITFFNANTNNAELKVSIGVEYPIHKVLVDPNDKFSGRTLKEMTIGSMFVTVGLSTDINPQIENCINKAFSYLRQQLRGQIEFLLSKLKNKKI